MGDPEYPPFTRNERATILPVSPRRLPSRHPSVTPLLSIASRLPAVVLCAFAAHAAVYGSVAPGDTGHSYFGWYGPIVTSISTASLVLLPVALAASLGGRPSRLGRVARLVLTGRGGAHGLWRRTAEVAIGSLCFLIAQETLERSVETNTLGPPHFGTFTWLVLVAAVASGAILVALLCRAVDGLVDELLGRSVSRSHATAPIIRRPALAAAGARPRPLAIHGALRAPPVLP